jgi:hypothetical protein
MAHPSKKERTPAAIKAIPQHEADARLLREKTARLKELRLAHGNYCDPLVRERRSSR